MQIPQIMLLVAAIIAGLLELENPNQRVFASVLLVFFSIILFMPYFWHGSAMRVHVALGLLTLLTAALLTLQPGWNFFPILFFMLAPMAVMHLPLRVGAIWIGVYILLTTGVMLVVTGPIGLAYAMPFAAGYIFFGIFGWIVIEAERNRARSEQLLAELQAAHQQLQEYAARVEDLTIAQERNRIAREMHDTLGHRLTIASVQLEGAQRLIPTNPERAVSIVETVREQVKEGLTELRRAVAMMRASVDEDLPIDKALIRLVEQVQQATALKIHLSLSGCPERLSLPQHQAIYRAAQEALTNIQRHARASEAWVQLSSGDGMVELLISDNGIGIISEAAHTGFGLLGLQERAAIQGGAFHIDERAGGGTQVSFRVPIVETPVVQPVSESKGGLDE